MLGVIFNPHTNKGTSVEAMADVRRILDDRGIEYIYRESNAPKDCIKIARELSETCDTLVACGGDGTLFEVVTGAADKNVTFCLFPLGSGNDVSRSIGMHGLTHEQLVDTLIAGKTRGFDVGDVNDRKYCSTLFVSYGVITNICARFAAMPKVSRFGYGYSAFRAILAHHVRNFTVTTDGGDVESVRVDLISVQNVRTAGGGITVCKEAEDNDGYLNLVLVHRKNRFRLLLNLVALVRGKLHTQPNVEIRKVKAVTIIPEITEVCCIDGELINEDMVSVKVLDRQIDMIYPADKE